MTTVTKRGTKEGIIAWIQEQMGLSGGKRVVIGLSGGKDSTIVAALCVQALGKENVYGIIMPEGCTPKLFEVMEAIDVAEYLDIQYEVVDIGPTVAALKTALPIPLSRQAELNIPPRVRMTVLYAVAQSQNNCRVTCNSNLSEDTMGYATKYGDTAGDLAPLMHLTVCEILELGKDMGLPEKYVEKTPEDGLTGMTDEDVFGFTYDQIDDYILKGTSGDIEIDKAIAQAEKYSRHKLLPIPTMK